MVSRIAFLFLILQFKYISSAENPILELPNGKILGRESRTIADTTYYSFQQIPYAAPPVGSLRFKAPTPVENWSGILNTTVITVSCYQLTRNDPTDAEDCLYLNVYTPQLPIEGENLSIPVMLYIHGGGFLTGSSIDIAPNLFIDNGVILVTINYRLSALGFLSTQDEVIPGNFGLKDQKFAIEWTVNNINLFGGDPSKITIFGESAGSASVSYQLLNQNNQGLFRGAILESGSSLSPWAYQRNAKNIAFELATVLNSTFAENKNSYDLLEFLETIDAKTLDAAAEEYKNMISTPWDDDVAQGLIFAPVIEAKNPEAFITKKMYKLLEAGNFVAVPIIIGVNSEESLLFNPDPEILQQTLEAWDQNLNLIVPNNMQISDSEEHLKMALAIRDIYTNGTPFEDKLAAGVRYSTDNAFIRGVTKHAEFFSEFAPTYFYQFSYDGEAGGVNIHYDGAEYVGHAEELSYIFCSGEDCSFSKFDESDKVTSQRLVTMWTNFAKFQNPIPETTDLLQNISWPQLNIENGDFLYLNIDKTLEIKNKLKAEFVEKWETLYNSLNFTDFDTY